MTHPIRSAPIKPGGRRRTLTVKPRPANWGLPKSMSSGWCPKCAKLVARGAHPQRKRNTAMTDRELIFAPSNRPAPAIIAGRALPALYAPDAHTAKRTFEFFTANIRNPNTRTAYARAAADFAD